MNDTGDKTPWLEALRLKAEKHLTKLKMPPVTNGDPSDADKILEQLRIHQAELEVQNQELLRSQTDLEMSRNRYYELFDLAPVGYFSLDPKGIIADVNLTGTDLLGTERIFLKDKPFLVNVEAHDHQHFLQLLGRAVKTGERISGELTLLRRDRSVFEARAEMVTTDPASPSRRHVLLTLLDITAQKQARTALEESQQMLSLVINSVPQYLFWKDRNAVYLGCNDNFCRLLDCSGPVDIIGRSDVELAWLPETAEVFHDAEFQVLESNRSILRQTETHQLPNGEHVIWETNRVPLHDMAGNVVGLLGCFDDITAKVNAQRKRHRLEAQLQQARKMEALGALAGGIAHDFNNILSAILGYSELVLGDLNPDERSFRNEKQVLKAVQRAKELVNQILAFSRQGDVDQHVFRLDKAVDDALKMIRASLPATIEIETSITGGNNYVMGNYSQIQQVIVNLCTNAAQTMEEHGGRLTVDVSEVYPDQAFGERHPQLKAGRYVKLTVTDDGPGIASEIMSRIFDPYFTTKKARQGTGLGLAVVHGILRNHGGEISVRNHVGRGAAFDVYLPEAMTAPATDDATPAPVMIEGTERVLIVDDEVMLINMHQSLLMRLGYDVTVFDDPRAALDAFKENPAAFDIMITDMTMPAMTGDILVRQIKKIRPELPVILCSGFCDEELENKAHDAGVGHVLLKPFDFKKLALTIRAMFDRMN